MIQSPDRPRPRRKCRRPMHPRRRIVPTSPSNIIIYVETISGCIWSLWMVIITQCSPCYRAVQPALFSMYPLFGPCVIKRSSCVHEVLTQSSYISIFIPYISANRMQGKTTIHATGIVHNCQLGVYLRVRVILYSKALYYGYYSTYTVVAATTVSIYKNRLAFVSLI